MPDIRVNRVKRKLQEGKVATVLGGPNNPEIVDYLGQFGFDGIWIETEHGPTTWEQVANISRACDLWDMTSLCRVNSNQPWLITRSLDVGATGIAVPHVNTKEEAQRAVKSAKYGPIGYRGMAAPRQSYGVTDFYPKANEQSLVVVLIEEIEAVNNLQDILTVDNIDVYYMARTDLSQTMGYTGQPNHPEVQAVVDRCMAQIVAAGKVTGTTVNDDNVESYIDKGARFFLTGWTQWVSRGANQYLSRVAAKGG